MSQIQEARDAALREAEDAILRTEARSDENGGSAASIVDCLKAVRALRDPVLVAEQFPWWSGGGAGREGVGNAAD